MKTLMKKSEDDLFEEEIDYLEKVREQQKKYYVEDILDVMDAVDEMKKILQEIKEDR